ncbi:hypothetical protein GN956_G12566 [Arapaima gigas]
MKKETVLTLGLILLLCVAVLHTEANKSSGVSSRKKMLDFLHRNAKNKKSKKPGCKNSRCKTVFHAPIALPLPFQ